MVELLDIYDKNRNKTGRVVKREAGTILSDEEYFLYAQCWIINLKGEILLTQRRVDKKDGGNWEPTGGCVVTGENTTQGIIRELEEEIGIFINKEELQLVKTIIDLKQNRNCFRDIYVLKKDIKLTELKFNDNAVVNAKYVTIEEFKAMIKNGEAISWLSFFGELYVEMNF